MADKGNARIHTQRERKIGSKFAVVVVAFFSFCYLLHIMLHITQCQSGQKTEAAQQ